MANTVTQPIALTTFISQINHLVQSTKTEANGAVVDQPRKPDRWDEMINRLLGLQNFQADWDGMGAKAPQATLACPRFMVQAL